MDNTAEQLKCREAFEREYRCEGASFRKTNGDYNGPLNTFWEVWQVAWNTRADSGEAADVRDAAIKTCKAFLDSLVEFDGVVDGELFNHAHDAVEDAISKRVEKGNE